MKKKKIVAVIATVLTVLFIDMVGNVVVSNVAFNWWQRTSIFAIGIAILFLWLNTYVENLKKGGEKMTKEIIEICPNPSCGKGKIFRNPTDGLDRVVVCPVCRILLKVPADKKKKITIFTVTTDGEEEPVFRKK